MSKKFVPHLAEGFVFFLASVFTLEVISLAVGMTLSRVSAAIVLIAGLVFVYLISGARVAMIIVLLSILFSLLAASLYDDSFDGQWYHQAAVAALANGWNPLREPFTANYLVDDGIGFGPTIELWITHYPKASWIVEALMFKLSNAIQMAKMVNLIGIFAAFGTTFGLISRYLSATPALFLALIAALNPISVTQVFTFYNDGLAASLMLVLVVSLVTLSLSGKWRDVLLPAAAITLLANLKFSILAMTIVLCIFGALAIAIRFRSAGVSKILVLGAVGILATTLLGWSPYMQNFLGHGHPFYPVMGPNAVDIMSGITPAAIRKSGEFTKFIIGNFSSPGSGEDEIRWLPDRMSMGWAGLADTRLGGFGVLSLVIGVMSLVGIIIFNFRSRNGTWGIFAILAIAASVMINPENWWARYVPQLWVVPAAVVFLLMTMRGRRAKIGGMFAIVMACNIAITTSASVRRSVSSTIQITSQDDAITSMGGRVKLVSGWFYGVWKRMVDHNIDVVRVSSPSELSCSDPKPVAASIGMASFCVIDK